MPALSGSQKAKMQSRFGPARFGATRFGYFSPNFVLSINGVDRSSWLTKRTLKIQQNYNGTPWTCRFTLNPGINFTVSADQLIYVGLGTVQNREFGGHILRVTHRRLKANVGSYLDIECNDFTPEFDSLTMVAGYENTPGDVIAIDLIQRFCPGFTFNNVQRGLPTIADFQVIDLKGSSAMRNLVTAMGGGGFYVDPYHDVHLFNTLGESTARSPTAPRPLTDAIAGSTLEDFRFYEDGGQERTRFIVGGSRTTCPIGTPSGDVSMTVNASGLVDFLVVGGGAAGGGSTGNGNGGGGGGGVIIGTDTITSGTYAVVIGSGGATTSADGSDSSFNGHTATKGGGGKSGPGNGNPGGSGGGAGSSDTTGGTGGTSVSGQGNDGGFAVPGNPGIGVAGSGAGGGGAAAGGSSATGGAGSFGANGGQGVSSAISGTVTIYGSGGGGGGAPGGGTGGTGAGNGSSNGVPGNNATGYGCGGGGSFNHATGGTGFQGVVIISYPIGAFSATGGTITTAGGRKIHTFTSNGSFVVSTTQLVAPVPMVVDLPLDDASQIDVAGGVVRIGTTVTAYTTTGGPVVPEGTNPPATTLSADVAIFATSISVVDSSIFTETTGWVKIADQYVRFTGVSAGTLGGIPNIGFGAINAAIKANTPVTWLGKLVIGGSGIIFSPPLPANSEVVQRVVVDNAPAAAALAARSGGTGIIEGVIDGNGLSVAGATTRGQGGQAVFSTPLIVANWTTRDMNARPGPPQVINRGAPDPLSTTLIITKAELTLDRGLRQPPLRVCEGSTLRLPQIVDTVLTNIT